LRIAKAIDEIEQIRIGKLAFAGLVPVGHTGDLHVAHARQELFDLARHIALDDLAMIEIHLHA